MSVNLNSHDGEVSENVSNGSWAAIVALARAFGDQIPGWNGCHDCQVWTPDQLRIMSQRLRQTAELEPILNELAEHGGVWIS
jgi:hypothetical protein